MKQRNEKCTYYVNYQKIYWMYVAYKKGKVLIVTKFDI